MKSINNDIPDNWEELKLYVITEQSDVVRYILSATKCFFYDTCAFWNHMCISDPSPIFEYIKSQKGVVILTKMILIELCSGNQKLWKEHIEYVKKMKQCGIIVLVIAEEDIFTVLCSCYSGIAQVNQMFSNAIKHTKSKMGSIEVLSNCSARDRFLAKRFFEEVRKSKTPRDNLGEELLAVCLHMLANIPSEEGYKYIVLTDDYAAIEILGKVKENVEKHIGRRCISGVTTAKLCWLMINNGISLEEINVKEIISSGRIDNQLRVYSSEQYELSPSEKIMTTEEFAKKILNDRGMKVYL